MLNKTNTKASSCLSILIFFSEIKSIMLILLAVVASKHSHEISEFNAVLNNLICFCIYFFVIHSILDDSEKLISKW